MKHRVGRPRKFKLTEIVTVDGRPAAVVDHRMRGTKAEYRIVPLTRGHRRFGPASWRSTTDLVTTGKFSWTGALVTYRANEWLEAELPEGRGCKCMCCAHTAIPRAAFSRHTGIMKEHDE